MRLKLKSRLENPVLVKELRERMRGRRAFVLLTAYLLLLLLALFSIWPHGRSYYPGWNVGRNIFSGLSMILMAVVVFVTPSFTSGAISMEKERKTLDLLVTTLLKPRTIILGKMMSSLSYILLLLAASLPFISVSFMLGGVSPREVALAYLLLTVTMLTFATIAMFCSFLFKRTSVASGVAYGVALLFVFGTIFFDQIIQHSARAGYDLILIKHLNPFFAMVSVYEKAGLLGAASSGLGLPPWGNLLVVYAGITALLLLIMLRFYEPLLKRGE